MISKSYTDWYPFYCGRLIIIFLAFGLPWISLTAKLTTATSDSSSTPPIVCSLNVDCVFINGLWFSGNRGISQFVLALTFNDSAVSSVSVNSTSAYVIVSPRNVLSAPFDDGEMWNFVYRAQYQLFVWNNSCVAYLSQQEPKCNVSSTFINTYFENLLKSREMWNWQTLEGTPYAYGLHRKITNNNTGNDTCATCDKRCPCPAVTCARCTTGTT